MKKIIKKQFSIFIVVLFTLSTIIACNSQGMRGGGNPTVPATTEKTITLYDQVDPFTITLEPLNIPNLTGVHSFAFGQSNGKWLIVGGRTEGLHQRRPFSAFDESGSNKQLIVIDPVSKEKWSTNLNTLPTSIQEQLSSTNMEFYQEGDYLYFLGGYGYSSTAGSHITYPKLTALKVSDVINAIVGQHTISEYFRQIEDSKFQVTGGRLGKIGNKYYLLGGQKFMGKYNPMGPNRGTGFVQEYTDAIRIFSLMDDGSNITINHLPSYTDTENLHRRDYNAAPQIMPNKQEGITMFSGVFQKTKNLPFLNCVNVTSGGYITKNDFKQYYNHYHCAFLPVYSDTDNEMHTIFFGGMAQYYIKKKNDNTGELIKDDNVPFVKTIARVTRTSTGEMKEYKFRIEMPSLLGSGAEFIPNLNVPHYDNEVFKLDGIPINTPTLMGYIYGGISSTARNIFFTNNGSQSTASSQIFKVTLTRKK